MDRARLNGAWKLDDALMARMLAWLDAWWSTLRIYADRDLYRQLTTPTDGDYGPVPPPPGLADADVRAYVSRLWAEDWNCPEDSAYDDL